MTAWYLPVGNPHLLQLPGEPQSRSVKNCCCFWVFWSLRARRWGPSISHKFRMHTSTFIKQPSKSAMLHYIQNLKYEYVKFKNHPLSIATWKGLEFNTLSAPSKTLTSQAWRSLSCDVAMTKRLESRGFETARSWSLFILFLLPCHHPATSSTPMLCLAFGPKELFATGSIYPVQSHRKELFWQTGHVHGLIRRPCRNLNVVLRWCKTLSSTFHGHSDLETEKWLLFG